MLFRRNRLLTDIIFDRLEMYDRDKKAIRQMISDGISESKICKYMGINKNDPENIAFGIVTGDYMDRCLREILKFYSLP